MLTARLGTQVTPDDITGLKVPMFMVCVGQSPYFDWVIPGVVAVSWTASLMKCPENDPLFPDEVREEGKKFLESNMIEHSIRVYSNVPHGMLPVPRDDLFDPCAATGKLQLNVLSMNGNCRVRSSRRVSGEAYPVCPGLGIRSDAGLVEDALERLSSAEETMNVEYNSELRWVFGSRSGLIPAGLCTWCSRMVFQLESTKSVVRLLITISKVSIVCVMLHIPYHRPRRCRELTQMINALMSLLAPYTSIVLQLVMLVLGELILDWYQLRCFGQ